MIRTNTAAALYGIRQFRLEERPVPAPAIGEVLVAVKSVGVCGSDVHYWDRGRIGHWVPDWPFVVGHECAGIVEELGPDVTTLKVGDRVALEPGIPCRRCLLCKSGRYNLCPDLRFWAAPPIDGALARYVTHAADFCYRLPDHVSLDEGAIIEPLSVGLHACRLGRVSPGSRVLVTGVGPIGLVTVLAAKVAGASLVVVADPREDRLAVAKRLGADTALSADRFNLADEVRRQADGGVDISIECSGAPTALSIALESTRAGGVVVLVGQGPDEVPFPIINLISREIEVRGSFRYVNTYPTAVKLLASGGIDVKPLITHRFPLQDVGTAFEVAHSSQDAIKVIVTLD